MTAPSDTPRTDAESYYVPPTDELHAIDGLTRVVPEDFARALERELTAALARAEKAEACRDELRRVTEAIGETAVNNTVTLEDAVRDLKVKAAVAEDALLRHGYRKSCGIPACNCGDQWNHGGHAVDRLREISEALHNDSPIDMQGKTLLNGVVEAIERLIADEAERDEAREALATLRAQNYETQSLLNGLEAELARLTTLRPVSEHDGKTRVIVYHWTTYADGTAEWVPQFLHNLVPRQDRWTPLPDVKEAT